MPEDHAPTVVTGRFATPESARAAMVRLEGKGIDAATIHLEETSVSVPRSDEASEIDLETTGDVAKGATVGATIGTVAGAAAGIVTGLVTGDAGAGAMVGTAGAVGGGVVGGLAGTYAGLPANPETWTTYELDPNDPHPVTVTVAVASEEEAELVRDTLRGA
jgi:hypothetical protein